MFHLRNLRFLSAIRPDLDNPEAATIQIWQEKVLHSPSLTYIDCYSLAACSEAVCYVIASTESCRPECTSSCILHSPKDIHPLYYYSTYLLREQRIHNHKRSELSERNTDHHQQQTMQVESKILINRCNYFNYLSLFVNNYLFCILRGC